MKLKIPFLFHAIICLCFTVISLIWCITSSSLHCSAKTTKPKWKKEITSLEIGKTYRYGIKHCPKKAKVQFSSNHISCAAINRKTGLLRAKKKGSVIISAKIRQQHKKTKILKTKIKITKKNATGTNQKNPFHLSKNTAKDNLSILNNVQFSVAESINPWNHSIMLYSNRILLPSEVQNTDLTLVPLTTKSNTKVDNALTAHFVSLSADGKTMTYQLNADSAKKLCPGNGTQDGTYNISSTFFHDTFLINYHERIQLNSISGFVLNTNQIPLSQVSIKLYADSQNIPLAVTTTDQNGYYQFQDITEENIRIEASSEGFETYTYSFLHPARQNICQNIILHPSSTDNLALSCRILNEQNHPIENAMVILTTEEVTSAAELLNQSSHKSENFFLQGMVDNNGTVCFTNQKNITSDGYTQIEYHMNQSTPRFISAKMPISNSIICDSHNPFTRNQEYLLYVLPSTDGTTIPKDYEMESFSFSFSSLLSDQLLLQIQLQRLPLLSAKKVSISADTLTNSVSSFRYSLYDRHGKVLFQTAFSPLSKNRTNDYSNQLTAALQYNKIRLLDGHYYAAVTAYDNTTPAEQISSETGNFSSGQIPTDFEYTSFGRVSSGTSILPVQIFNNEISPANFILAPCQTFHSLLYTDYQDEILENMSLTLYQKMDTIYFPIGTYTTNSFSPIHSGQKAYLQLPVLADSSYILEPTNTEYKISTGSSFQVLMEQNRKFSSNIPEHQILFDKITDDKDNINCTLNLSDLLDYINLCKNKNSFLADYFSHSATYPNTVYAYYQTDGTFTTLLFATPAFSSLENLSSTLICNQLQNGMMIHTSQKSYSTTPFFVT